MNDYKSYYEKPVPEKERFARDMTIDDFIDQNLMHPDGEEKLENFLRSYFGGMLAKAEHIAKTMCEQGKKLLKRIQPEITSARRSLSKQTQYIEKPNPDLNAKPWTWPSLTWFIFLCSFTFAIMTIGVSSFANQLLNSSSDYLSHPILEYVISLIVPCMSICLELISRRLSAVKYAALVGGLLSGFVWIYLSTQGFASFSLDEVLASSGLLGGNANDFYSHWKFITLVVGEMLMSCFLLSEGDRIYQSHQVKPLMVVNPVYKIHKDRLDDLLLDQQKMEQKVAEWRAYRDHYLHEFDTVKQNALSAYAHKKHIQDAELVKAELTLKNFERKQNGISRQPRVETMNRIGE